MPISNSWFIRSAIKALEDNNNVPMSSAEIWDKIAPDYKGSGKTPKASLVSRLLEFSKKSKYSHITKRRHCEDVFEITQIDPQKFKLLHYQGNSDIKDNDVKEDEKEKEIKEDIISLTSKRLDWKELIIFKDWTYEINELKDFTYVAKDLHEWKIGYTSRTPDDRIKDFKTGNPNISLIYAFSGNIEKKLHKRFNHLRSRENREWFYPAKELTDYINDEIEKNKKYIDWYIKKIEIDQIQDEIERMRKK